MTRSFGLIQARALGRLFFLCALIGVIAGIGAIAFHSLLNLSSRFFLDGIAGYRPAGPGGEGPLFAPSTHSFSRLWLFLLPVLGGLLSGGIVYTLAPEAEGHGTDAAIKSFHKFAGRVRARVAPIKLVASAITIGTGGSAGREGPIAQIGSSFGSLLATFLKLSDRERRIMMAAGMGAGVGAIFHAPLAGAIFSAEVLYSEIDFEYEVIAPSILASIVAYSVFSLAFGWNPLFTTPTYAFRNPVELIPYSVLGLAVAAGGLLYVRSFYATRNWFRRLRIPNHVKPALGGLGVGTVGLLVPDALASGYGVAQGALLGNLGAGFLVVVVLAKIVTTSLTIGSGGSGGVFGPSMVIGGALGGAVGLLLQQALPAAWVPHPGSFAVVGMAGFFAGVANTPLSTVIMVSEMTGNYDLLVPSMWVCTLSFLLLRKHTIYEEQLPTRASTPAHFADAVGQVLRHFRVRDILDGRKAPPIRAVPEDMPLNEVLQRLGESDRSCLPVKDSGGKLIGSIHLDTVRHVLGEPTVQSLIIARDAMTNAARVAPEDDIETALRLMEATNRREVLVVGEDGHAVDALSAGDIMVAYEHELTSLPADATQTPFARSVFLRRIGELLSRR